MIMKDALEYGDNKNLKLAHMSKEKLCQKCQQSISNLQLLKMQKSLFNKITSI